MTTITVPLDPAAPVPLYGQIAARIRDRIASGDLRSGDSLPAVRRLASDLGVSLNTVARAYRQLEEDGYVRIVDRVGVEVTAAQRELDDEDELVDGLTSALAELRDAGLSRRAIRRLVTRETERLWNDSDGGS